jgi:hypothetical protein
MFEGQNIRELCLRCQTLYINLASTFEGSETEKRLRKAEIEDERAKFRIWANKAGATATGKTSLQARLEGSNYLYHGVIQLLHCLVECLEEGGFRESIMLKFPAISIAQIVDENNSHHKSTEFSIAEFPNEAGEGREEGVIDTYWFQLRRIVTKLFDVTGPIRKTSTHARFMRAALHQEISKDGCDLVEEFRNVIASEIAERLKTTPQWLANVLTRAITMRRQRLYYARALDKGKDKTNATHRAPAPAIAEIGGAGAGQVPSPKPHSDPAFRKVPTGPNRAGFDHFLTDQPTSASTSADIVQEYHGRGDYETESGTWEFSLPRRNSISGKLKCNYCFEDLPDACLDPQVWRYASMYFDFLTIIDRMSWQTSSLIPVYGVIVLIGTGFSKQRKDGSTTRFNFIRWCGVATVIVPMTTTPYTSHQKKSSESTSFPTMAYSMKTN